MRRLPSPAPGQPPAYYVAWYGFYTVLGLLCAAAFAGGLLLGFYVL